MHKLWRTITTVCCWLWRLLSFIRTAVQNLLFVGCALAAVTFIFQYGNKIEQRGAGIKPGALVLDLQGRITDSIPLRQQSRGWFHQWATRSPALGNALFEIVGAIRQAKSDPNIKGIVLSLQNFDGANQPALRYIGKALTEFRNSGKPIYAFGDSYTQDQYYLASFATTIALAPHGSVDLYGLARENFYYRTLLDNLKISTHIFRVGTYKSAVEPLLRDDMSPEVRADEQQRLQRLWQSFIDDIAANRQLPKRTLTPEPASYIEDLRRLQGDNAQYALQHQWVDQLISAHENRESLLTFFGKQAKNEALNAVSIYDYNPSQKHASQPDPGRLPHIAVVVANGPLIYGVAKPGSVGSETTVKLLRQACYDKKIKAVILHINSPGGSVQASEAIRSQVTALKYAGKPVVVSMGGAAASGGYWIASAADHIVANASTVTGSIGIFGIIHTFENSFRSIGLQADGVTTSSLANFSVNRSLSPALSELIQISVEKGYSQFIELVAKARHKSLKEVEALAQGRVWLGQEAYDKGLVDQLGDFDDALAQAAELAQLKQYRLIWLAPQPSEWLEYLFGVDHAQSIKTLLRSLSISSFQQLFDQTQAQILGAFNDPLRRYAFCFSCQKD
ncbi:signal peptide peptidase SppA [unidentified bacterial endosymbiont]|uniref:signal peptide peptidase SppA n=1 Tax=unidentified bacterial endosymbiont TaxID=2355 RepID=UPI0020A0D853|nr:signal peptide peptidase SppA [unidentified bacterial endosymbiont]